jgi:elongation factor P--(R)-beta-lysine ligase
VSEPRALGFPERVAVWDAALAAVRAQLRGEGLFEVVTPVRLAAVAVEPFIEPVAAPPGLLATSPELPMKRLLCRGAPSIFQIATCFRAGERGDLHREELHLVEWYRVHADTPVLRADVERVVAAVFEAVAQALGEPGPAPPRAWAQVGMLDLVEETLGVALRGDEDAEALARALRPVSTALRDPLAAVPDARLAKAPRARTLAAWTAFFSAWCDARLDPWLRARRDQGVHLVDFPLPLAALSAHGLASSSCPRDPPASPPRMVAHRFESHVHGCELANGYRELRDADEQARRFEDVNALRAALARPPLPIDPGFLADLRAPGLPPCAGVALGLDRLVLLASGRRRLADVAIELGTPDA